MNKHYSVTDNDVIEYVNRLFGEDPKELQEIRKRAESSGVPPIHVGLMDGRHLEAMARAIQPKKAVEVGTLAGYSAVRIARGLAPGGRLYTCEFSPMHAKVAQETFEKNKVADRIQILIGAASDTLPTIEKEGPFDFVFIDADKRSYPKYLKWAEKNLRVGGVLLADNTFGWGMISKTRDEVIREESADTALDIAGLQEFNQQLAQSRTFFATMLPTAEGLTFAVRTDGKI